MNKPGARILLFDIETTPNLAYVWEKYEQDVIRFEREWEMLSVAWKWLDENKIGVISRRTLSEKQLIKKLWQLFDEADIIIAHNGDAFDVKKSNAKFVQFGFNPPSFYKTIDTKKVAKKYFRFNSASLDDIANRLNLGRKVKTGGFDLWIDCIAGNKQAWRLMEEYNKNDVSLLEKVYLKLRHWMTSHPNSNLYNESTHSCPICGSAKTQKRGHRMTTVGKRQSYQCQSCGGWSQGSIIKTDIVLR